MCIYRFGRRTILFVPMIGLTICKILYFFVTYFRWSYYLYVLLAANFIQGCSGGGGVFQMGIFTYASDITENNLEFRTQLFSILESILFIAKIIGPVLGGLWAKYRGLSEPLLYGSVIMIIAGIWGYFTIPESLPSDAKVRKNEITFNPTKTLKNLYKILKLKFDKGKSPIPYILFANFIVIFVLMGNASILVYYVTVKFNWTAETVGYYMATEGVMQSVSMLFLPYLVEKLLKLKFDNVYWIGGGYLLRSLSYLAIGVCTTTNQVFYSAIILFFTGPYYPRNRVLLSNSVSPANQATMQSAIAAVDSIGSFITPLITLTYSLTVGQSPSIVYYIMSSLVFFASIVVLYTTWIPGLFRNLPESIDRYRGKDRDDVEKEVKRTASANDRTYSASEPLLSAPDINEGSSAAENDDDDNNDN